MAEGGQIRFGPYVVESELGRGGMGVVYRAVPESGGDPVALKVLGDACGPEAAARFQREVRLAAELDHPGIVRCLASGVEDGQAWFAMELVEGRPLDRAIAELEFDWRQAVQIVRDAAIAVGAAHARGVLHRDLKPSNILLGGEGRPRVADFGLAKDTRTGSKYTRTGETLGTPAYMSPEQARGELADLTPASDVWSLGCVLYEMLAGRPAFAGDTPAGVVGQVLTASPGSLRAGLPGLPRPVVELVMGALDRNPHRRPEDGAAYAAECERVLAGGRPEHRGPRSRRAAVLAGVAVLVVAAAVAPFAWRPAPERPPPEPQADQAAVLAEQGLREGVADPVAGSDLLRQALALRPDRSDWRVELGRFEWLGGDPERARETWEGVAAGDSRFLQAKLQQGLSHLFYWRPGGGFTFDEAMAHLNALLNEEDDAGRLARAAAAMIEHRAADVAAELGELAGWEAELIRGLAAQRAGDTEAALRAFDAAIAQGIRFDWVRINRAAAVTALGDPARAVRELEAVLADLPSSLYARLAHADALHRAGRDDEALAAYNDLLERGGAPGKAWVARGTILMARGRHAEALRDFNAGISANPNDSRAVANRGILFSTTGRPEAALQDLRRAAELEPDSADVYANLGVVFKTLQRWPEAESAYSRAIALGGERVELFVNRASARSALGNLPGALEDLATAEQIDPKSPLPPLMRAHILAGANRLPEADVAVARALERRPGFADALALRAKLHYAQQRFPQAYRDYARLARHAPDRSDHWLWAGHAAAGAQLHRETVEALERYLELVPSGRDADNARKMITYHRARQR